MYVPSHSGKAMQLLYLSYHIYLSARMARAILALPVTIIKCQNGSSTSRYVNNI